ncbi:MAG: rhodanese-like domain-containing protein [Deltaproteobacteria bacterium]|nr:rhodanese-like domain-containing protein [Deltaproteobacteria bacterium]MBW2117132.1 rhodanese-like domain-containing protein [Deltaproteobacteria bacterium]MBW2342747.1 rhodanese-like domain-containing protein [Deltaproteobacteria bacterium]
MKKKRWFALLSIMVAIGFCLSFVPVDQSAAGDVFKVKGKVKGVSNRAKTISLSVKGKGAMVFKFNDKTRFINATSARDMKKGEAAVVKYKSAGPDMLAVSITKAIAKMPEGVGVIKTPEVAALVKKGPKAGNYYLIDTRPAKRYKAGHIPTAVSVPLTKLKKEGKGLLPAKGKTLIFYCGGPT